MNDLPVKKETNSKQVIFRSFLLLTGMLFLFLITFSTSLYAGVRSGELNTRILKPIKEKVDAYNQFWQVVNSISDDTNNNQEIFDEASSSAETNIQEITPTPTIIQYKIQYVYPTYTPPKYPTLKPGDPGSPEWQAKFDQMQKDFENAKQRTCSIKPDLCD